MPPFLKVRASESKESLGTVRVLYRTATAAELPAAVALRAQMDEELNGRSADAAVAAWRSRFVEFFSSRMADGTAAVFFAAASDGEPVAMGAVYQLPNHRAAIFSQIAAYVTSIFVKPDWRRRGIATELTRMAIAWAREHGSVVIRLRPSQGGRSVYEALGFEQSEEMELWLD